MSLERPLTHPETLRKQLSEDSTWVNDVANMQFFEKSYKNEEAMLQDGWENVSSKSDYINPKNPNQRQLKCYRRVNSGNGRIYEIWIDQFNDVETFTLTGNELDKECGNVGTDGKAIVKRFGNNAYDYLKVDDFIDRFNLIYEAAKRLFSNIPDSQEKQHKLDWLEHYKKQTLQKIHDECQFDDKRHLIVEFETEKFKKAHAKAKHILQQSLVDIAGIAVDSQTDREKINSFVNNIKQAEKDFIRERGRPFIIKIGKIDDSTNKAVSVQFPLGEETIPSSDRTGQHDTLLSNYVIDGSGTVDEKGNISIETCITGHSSLPPIKETITMTRRHKAYLAQIQHITELTEKIFESNPKTTDPITLPLSDMLLLSPLGKGEDPLRGSQSEHSQLSHTRSAMEMLRYQDQPIEITLKNGKTVFVSVDLTYMNLPVNDTMEWQDFPLVSDPIQKGINARGFYEFEKNITEGLISALDKMDLSIIDPDSLLSSHLKIETTLLNETIQQSLDELDPDNLGLASVKNDLESKLKNSYRELREFFENTYDPQNEEHKKQYRRLKNTIEKHQNKLDTLYIAIKHAQRKIYNTNKASKELLAEKLRKFVVDHKDSPDEKTQKLRKIYITYLRFLTSEKIFHEEKYKKREYAYQFQANYVLANEELGRITEANCKSCEDRGGRLRVECLIHQIFEKKYGRPPDLDYSNDKELRDKELYNYNAIKKRVMFFSASIENTKYNSESRSYQISTEVTDPDLNLDSGKKMSTLAKTIFKGLDPFIPQENLDLFVSLETAKNILMDPTLDEALNIFNETKDFIRSYLEQNNTLTRNEKEEILQYVRQLSSHLQALEQSKYVLDNKDQFMEYIKNSLTSTKHFLFALPNEILDCLKLLEDSARIAGNQLQDKFLIPHRRVEGEWELFNFKENETYNSVLAKYQRRSSSNVSQDNQTTLSVRKNLEKFNKNTYTLTTFPEQHGLKILSGCDNEQLNNNDQPKNISQPSLRSAIVKRPENLNIANRWAEALGIDSRSTSALLKTLYSLNLPITEKNISRFISRFIDEPLDKETLEHLRNIYDETMTQKIGDLTYPSEEVLDMVRTHYLTLQTFIEEKTNKPVDKETLFSFKSGHIEDPNVLRAHVIISNLMGYKITLNDAGLFSSPEKKQEFIRGYKKHCQSSQDVQEKPVTNRLMDLKGIKKVEKNMKKMTADPIAGNVPKPKIGSS